MKSNPRLYSFFVFKFQISQFLDQLDVSFYLFFRALKKSSLLLIKYIFFACDYYIIVCTTIAHVHKVAKVNKTKRKVAKKSK